MTTESWTATTDSAPPKHLTRTRKAVNALCVEDYTQLCQEIETTSRRLRELLVAKADLELLASFSKIVLAPRSDG